MPYHLATPQYKGKIRGAGQHVRPAELSLGWVKGFEPSASRATIWRARNIASPKNAQRLQKKTPCALRGDKCYDCSSPDRICRGLVVLWEPVKGIGETEVVLIGETLGY